MKPTFKIQKMPLEDLLSILIELYESGVDYVDLTADNSDPQQDKLIIQAQEEYINPDFADDFKPAIIEKLTDDDINKLL